MGWGKPNCGAMGGTHPLVGVMGWGTPNCGAMGGTHPTVGVMGWDILTFWEARIGRHIHGLWGDGLHMPTCEHDAVDKPTCGVMKGTHKQFGYSTIGDRGIHMTL